MSGPSADHLAALRADYVDMIRRNTGCDEANAMRIASQCIAALQQRFAGERVYFPAPKYDAGAILADFNGRNRDEVCRKHRVSRRLLYKLLRQRAKKVHALP